MTQSELRWLSQDCALKLREDLIGTFEPINILNASRELLESLSKLFESTDLSVAQCFDQAAYHVKLVSIKYERGAVESAADLASEGQL
jgi:hypothetical protein